MATGHLFPPFKNVPPGNFFLFPPICPNSTFLCHFPSIHSVSLLNGHLGMREEDGVPYSKTAANPPNGDRLTQPSMVYNRRRIALLLYVLLPGFFLPAGSESSVPFVAPQGPTMSIRRPPFFIVQSADFPTANTSSFSSSSSSLHPHPSIGRGKRRWAQQSKNGKGQRRRRWVKGRRASGKKRKRRRPKGRGRKGSSSSSSF